MASYNASNNQSNLPQDLNQEGSAQRQLWATLTQDDIDEVRNLGTGFKKCPSCKAIIEKNAGANQLRCPICSHEFCWMCGRDWSEHAGHYYECPFYKAEEDPFLNNLERTNQ